MADSIEVSARRAADKAPRTDRGRRTLRKLLDAAAAEFGERGFHEASISAITRRAGTALGSFYTYFDSKDAIFRALVADMSAQVRDHAGSAIGTVEGAIATERAVLAIFLRFAREHREIYRIINEAEFIHPAGFRAHYDTAAQRIADRLHKGVESGELRPDIGEVEAWALMGMNVFLGLRYGIREPGVAVDAIAAAANRLIEEGLTRRG